MQAIKADSADSTIKFLLGEDRRIPDSSSEIRTDGTVLDKLEK